MLPNLEKDVTKHITQLKLDREDPHWRYSPLEEAAVFERLKPKEHVPFIANKTLDIKIHSRFVLDIQDGTIIPGDVSTADLDNHDFKHPDGELFAEIYRQYASDPVKLQPTFDENEILLIRNLLSEKTIIAPRIIIEVPKNKKLTIFELFQATYQGDYLTLPVYNIFVGENSLVNFVRVQWLPKSAMHFGYAKITLDRYSQFRTTLVSLGCGYDRMRVDAELLGEGANYLFNSLSSAKEGQVHDLRTYQCHLGGSTTGTMVTASTVNSGGHSIYTGYIEMKKGAKKANARQESKNLILGANAKAESEPILDIKENDVRCDHASAVGPIDQEWINYLCSRGVSEDKAKELIITGFRKEIIKRCENDLLEKELWRIVKLYEASS